MGTTLGTNQQVPDDIDMAYPPGMELHGSKWRIKKRVPQDLRRKHPDLYPSQFLTLQTEESDRRAAARKAWGWLGTIEAAFHWVRKTGKRVEVAPSVVPQSLQGEIPHHAASAQTASRKPGLTPPRLSKVIEYFISKQDQSVPMFKKYRPALDLFLEITGDRPVSEIRQIDVEDYFDLLCKLPPRWFDEKRKRRVSARELAGMEWPQGISFKTFKDGYLAAFRPFLSASIRTFRDQGFPATLTVEGIKYTGDRKERDHAQRAFKPSELERLFCGPEYRRFAADPCLQHCYWLPLVGLYTGARINEVCQLNPQCDIRQERGVWVFDITEASETDARVKKSVKNNPSRRLVPIHSQLLELGLLGYVEKRKESGDKLIFPMWKPSANGRAAGVAERWFRRLLEETKLRDETPKARLVGFHAFRSTLLNRALNLGVPNAHCLTGHSNPHVSGVVEGYQGVVDVAVKKKLMEVIVFDVTPPRPQSYDGDAELASAPD